jgi:DNA-binding CsgD family transcriptional regulator
MSIHVFIFLYIAAFVFGIALITMNHQRVRYADDPFNRTLQCYYIVFTGHITIDFVYFYGWYFGYGWSLLNEILLVVNIGFTAFLYIALNTAQRYLGGSMKFYRVFFVPVALLYVISYYVWGSRSIGTEYPSIGSLSSNVMLSAGAALIVITAIYFFRTSNGLFETKISNTKKKLFHAFCFCVFGYTAFNFYVDLSFCLNAYHDLWGINIYNFTVVFYILLNTLSFFLFYKQAAVHEKAVPAERYRLTAREKEVYEQVLGGKSNAQIAASLFISENTVKRHVNNIFRKAGVKSRYELLSKSMS